MCKIINWNVKTVTDCIIFCEVTFPSNWQFQSQEQNKKWILYSKSNSSEGLGCKWTLYLSLQKNHLKLSN